MDRPPTTSQLLNVWEQARSQTPVQRALSLLALATSAQSVAELSKYSIGRRDQELLDLREQLFGPRMTGTAACPACQETIEVDFAVSDMQAESAVDPDQLHSVETDGWEVRFRLPNCSDLALIAAEPDPGTQRTKLLQRCLAGARRDGHNTLFDPIPETIATAVSQRMAELDPQGDIQLALTCPKCGHLWSAPMDIVSYLWSEIHAWAGRTLRDVHEIAQAYGWREAEILALSPARRQAYLELIRQ